MADDLADRAHARGGGSARSTMSGSSMAFRLVPRPAWAALPPELGDPVIFGRGVSDQALGQGEDPLGHSEGQRETAAAGTEMWFRQPDRVVRLEPHVNQLGILQHPPAVAAPGQRDRPLFRMRPALVMIAGLADLAIAVVFPGKRYPVSAPGDKTAVFHQHRSVPGPGMGIPGQLRGPRHHLLGHMTVMTLERAPLRRLP